MSKILRFPENKIQTLIKIIIVRFFFPPTYRQELEYPALFSCRNFPQLLKFYNIELLLEIKKLLYKKTYQRCTMSSS